MPNKALEPTVTSVTPPAFAGAAPAAPVAHLWRSAEESARLPLASAAPKWDQ